MHAQEIRDFVEILSRRSWETMPIDEKSRVLFVRLVEKLKVLKSKGKTSMDFRWEIWTKVRRPTKSEYVERFSEEYDDDDTGAHTEQFEKWWKTECPDKDVWLKTTVVEHTVPARGSYCGLFIGKDYVLSINDPNEPAGPVVDAEELLLWLHSAVDAAIEMVKDGTYNSWLGENLPYKNRAGTILRKDYYDAYPEERAKLRGVLSDAEIERFCRLAKKTDIPKNDLLSQMTARIFFEACAVGYKAAGYEKGKVLFQLKPSRNLPTTSGEECAFL